MSLPGDLPGLSSVKWLSDMEKKRISTIAQLLNLLPVESSAVLTSAGTLLTELFSHKGEIRDKTHTYQDKWHLCLLFFPHKSQRTWLQEGSPTWRQASFVFLMWWILGQILLVKSLINDNRMSLTSKKEKCFYCLYFLDPQCDNKETCLYCFIRLSGAGTLFKNGDPIHRYVMLGIYFF